MGGNSTKKESAEKQRTYEEDKERMSYVFFSYPNYDAKIPEISSKREYSLVKDQSKDDLRDGEEDLKSISFGAYIKKKWSQVQTFDS